MKPFNLFLSRSCKPFVLTLLWLIGAIGSNALWAQNSALLDLARAAENEGEALWYDSSPEDQTAKILTAFNAAYPKVKVKHIRLVGGVDIAARMVQEARAAGQSADVATLAVDQVWALNNRGLLSGADWQKYGVPKELVPQPFAVLTTASVYVAIYNTQLVKPAEAPKQWEDLLHPRWKGRIGTWSSAQALTQLVPAWGSDKTSEYVDKFAAQNPVLYKSNFPLAQAVAAGELPVALGIYHAAQPAISKGAPIKVVMLNPTTKSTVYSVVAKHAPNPNTARLFVVWLTSPEGAKAYEDATARGNPVLASTRTSAMLKGLQQSEFPIHETQEGAKWLTRFSEAVKKGGKSN